MYRCEDCGLIFDEPKQFHDDTGEILSVCPDCLGEFDEVHECEDCGEYTLITQDLCNECQQTVVDTYNEDFKKYNVYELEYLNKNFDIGRIKWHG